VRVLAENINQEAGYHEATWTGENDFGNYVGSDLYIFKFYVKFTDGSTKTIIKPVGICQLKEPVVGFMHTNPFNVGQVSLDYSYATDEELNYTHRFALALQLGGVK